MSPSRISNNAQLAAQPTAKTIGVSNPGIPTSSNGSKTFGNMYTSMVESKFLSHPEELGVVAVGFSGGQVSHPAQHITDRI